MSRETGRSACVITYTPKSFSPKGDTPSCKPNTCPPEKETKSASSTRKRSRENRPPTLSPARSVTLPNPSAYGDKRERIVVRSTATDRIASSSRCSETHNADARETSQGGDAGRNSAPSRNNNRGGTRVLVNGCAGQLVELEQGDVSGGEGVASSSSRSNTGKEKQAGGDGVVKTPRSLLPPTQPAGFCSATGEQRAPLRCGGAVTGEGECAVARVATLNAQNGTGVTRLLAACIDTSSPRQPLCHAPMNAIGAVGRQLVENALGEGGQQRTVNTTRSSTVEGVDDDKGQLCTASEHAELVDREEVVGDEVSQGNYYCQGCTVYCSHEPCVMCAMALVHSRIDMLVFYHKNEEHGGITKGRLHLDRRLNHGYRVFSVKQK